ncbi:MAG: ABC transporter permease [Lachnospiraceae bacterium]
MLAQLFLKECKQTARSLIYWLIVLVLIFDFTTQLGGMDIKKKPEAGEESYGTKQSRDPEMIMKSTLGQLVEEYWRENYTTYPIGFYKNVTLNEADDQKIREILKETTGITDRDAAEQAVDAWYAAHEEEKGLNPSETETVKPAEPFKAEPLEGLTYDRFKELMEEADRILGGGSNYSKEYREKNAVVPMTYEDALKEYEALIGEDGLTGGYARLFSDYMVIFLGILPVFLAVTRGLRDRRSMMQELIYTRRCPAFTIMAGRYLAMVAMLTIPVLLLSLVPFSKCMDYARTAGIAVDMLAFVKYVFGWLVPTIMAVTAVGMLFTELTDTAVAVLIQGAWWFTAVFGGIGSLHGGSYGWSLVPRHNTPMNWQGFHDGFAQLLANRLLYAGAGLILMVLTALIYTQKRKGRLKIRGKISAYRKNKSEV